MEPPLDIIDGCLRQDRKCQQVLYESYYGLCLKTVFRYVDTYEQAVEVTNDGFVKVFRSIGRFEVRDLNRVEIVLIGWMKRVMINTAIDFQRRQNHKLITTPIDSLICDYQDSSQLSDAVLKYKELMDLIRGLPPAYRLVFNLHVIEGYSHQEIAEMTGISVGASKSNLFKARAQLQKKLTVEKTEFVLCQI